MSEPRMRICPGCNATFGATEGHACATTVYAGQGAGHLAMVLLADKAREVDALKASLAAAERARDEAVAMVDSLNESVAAMEERDRWPKCACSYDKPTDVCATHSPRLARVEAERDEAVAALRANGPALQYADEVIHGEFCDSTECRAVCKEFRALANRARAVLEGDK